MTRLGFWTGRSALLFLAVVLSFSSVPAQTPDSVPQRRPNSLEPGAWALQFEVSRSVVTSFQDFGISLKHHFSSAGALRFGVGFSTSSSDFDFSGRSLQADTIIQKSSSKSDGSGLSVELATQYVVYPAPTAPVNLFLGGGPSVRYRHSNFEDKRSSTTFGTPRILSQQSEENTWMIGVSGIFGVEWFAAKNIGFSGEYDLALQYFRGKRSSTFREDSPGVFNGESESTSRNLRFELATVKFGLSVYF